MAGERHEFGSPRAQLPRFVLRQSSTTTRPGFRKVLRRASVERSPTWVGPLAGRAGSRFALGRGCATANCKVDDAGEQPRPGTCHFPMVAQKTKKRRFIGRAPRSTVCGRTAPPRPQGHRFASRLCAVHGAPSLRFLRETWASVLAETTVHGATPGRDPTRSTPTSLIGPRHFEKMGRGLWRETRAKGRFPRREKRHPTTIIFPHLMSRGPIFSSAGWFKRAPPNKSPLVNSMTFRLVDCPTCCWENATAGCHKNRLIPTTRPPSWSATMI